MKRLVSGITLLAATLCVPAAFSQVRLPNVLSDHAVLQRDRPAHVWGWAAPGEEVTVSIHGQKASGKADAQGHWQVMLKPEPAGGPFEMLIEAKNHIKLKDIMFGDVYLASGQSNMGFSFAGIGGSIMPNAKEVLAGASDPNLRLLMVPKEYKSTAQDDQPTKWSVSSPQSAQLFSLIGYLFGRAISDREHVPVGIIQAAYGGTPVEAWVSTEGLAAIPQIQSQLPVWASQVTSESGAEMRRAARAGAASKAEESVPARAGTPGAAAPERHHPGNWAAASLYNAMISPVTPYTIKGALWYQGESSTDPTRAPYYFDTLSGMIKDWRTKFSEPDFPFLIVQISRYQAPAQMSWGTIRNDERRAFLAVPNTGLAVTYDLGIPDNPHVPYKQVVTDRLVLIARDLIYGEKIEDSGPMFKGATREGAAMRVAFTHAEKLQAPKDAPLTGFEIAGADAKFVAATAKIDGSSVVVSSPTVAAPKFVRYAWANYTDANLYNAFALPASTFTSENITQ